jgi:hypothetical protein
VPLLERVDSAAVLRRELMGEVALSTVFGDGRLNALRVVDRRSRFGSLSLPPTHAISEPRLTLKNEDSRSRPGHDEGQRRAPEATTDSQEVVARGGHPIFLSHISRRLPKPPHPWRVRILLQQSLEAKRRPRRRRRSS